jgi:hypothetical protein
LPYPFGLAVATLNQGRAALRAGDFGRARSKFDETRQQFADMDSRYYLSECELSMLELRLRTRAGDDDVADVGRVAAEIEAREGDPYLAYPLARLRAVALARAGEAAQAVEVVTESINQAEVAGYLFDLAAGLRLRAALAPLARREPEADDEVVGHLFDLAAGPRLRSAVAPLAGREPKANDQSRSDNLFASLGVVDPPTWDLGGV